MWKQEQKKKRNKKQVPISDNEEEELIKKQRKEIKKQSQLAIEDKPKTQQSASSSSKAKPPMKTIKKTEPKEPEYEEPPHKAPSQMNNLTHLSEILTHAYENKKLSPEAISDFLKARDEMMANKGNKQIRQKTKLKYQEIYKNEIYKK